MHISASSLGTPDDTKASVIKFSAVFQSRFIFGIIILLGITEEAEYDKLPDDAKRDPRRLSLHKADINNVSFDPTIELVAIELVDCEFTDCHITFKLTASSLEKCVLINTDISDSEFNKCVLNKLKVDGLMITNVQFDDSTIMRTSFKDAILEEWFGAPATSFIKCDFTNTQLKGCDMKKNAFTPEVFLGIDGS